MYFARVGAIFGFCFVWILLVFFLSLHSVLWNTLISVDYYFNFGFTSGSDGEFFGSPMRNGFLRIEKKEEISAVKDVVMKHLHWIKWNPLLFILMVGFEEVLAIINMKTDFDEYLNVFQFQKRIALTHSHTHSHS